MPDTSSLPGRHRKTVTASLGPLPIERTAGTESTKEQVSESLSQFERLISLGHCIFLLFLVVLRMESKCYLTCAG